MTTASAVETFAFTPRAQAAWFDQVGLEHEEWIIDRLVPSRSYTGIFGRRGAAKSFLALEMAACGGLGLPFLGERCSRFGSVYCVGEKKARFGKRVEAWRRARGFQDVPVWFRWGVPNLLDEGDVDTFIAELERLQPAFAARNAPLRAVFLDTLSRALRGANVSDADATGKALNSIQRIIDQTGVTVIPLAHVAKDADRAGVQKGAGEWEDAADALIRIDRKEGESVRVVTLTKQSDEADGLAYAFELEVVDLEETDAGSRITSCVIRQVDVPGGDTSRPKRPPTLKPEATILLRAIGLAIDADDAVTVPPSVSGARTVQRGATRAAVKRHAMRIGFADPDTKPGTLRSQINRAYQALIAQEKVRLNEELVWLP